jgi:putative DNA primase/helicase
MESRALDDAKDFLAEILKDGPKPARELFDAGKEEGFSKQTLRRARKALGIRTWRKGMPGKTFWEVAQKAGVVA